MIYSYNNYCYYWIYSYNIVTIVTIASLLHFLTHVKKCANKFL